MTHRDGEETDERFEAGAERLALDVDAVDRVGTIADDDRNAVPAARLQAVRHRVDVGVDAGADVLQVDDQDIEAAQHGIGRLARLAVQRVDRNPPRRVVAVRRLDHVVLDVRAEPVLRAEDGGQRHAIGRRHAIEDMDEAAVDGRVITEHADTQPPQSRRPEQDVGAETDAGRGRGGRLRCREWHKSPWYLSYKESAEVPDDSRLRWALD